MVYPHISAIYTIIDSIFGNNEKISFIKTVNNIVSIRKLLPRIIIIYSVYCIFGGNIMTWAVLD